MNTLLTFGMIAVLLCADATAEDTGKTLARAGYNPSSVRNEGSSMEIFRESNCSFDVDVALHARHLQEVRAFILNQDAEALQEEKVSLLLRYAVGFAKTYEMHRNGDIPSQAPLKPDGAVGGIDDVFRHITVGDRDKGDWCVKFASTLATLVDEDFAQRGFGNEKTDLHGTSENPWKAGDIASAARLLAIFDPHTDIHSIDWCSGQKSCKAPVKQKGSFIPATERPRLGCLAVFYDSKTGQGHVGFVIARDGGTITTIEANAISPSDAAPGAAPSTEDDEHGIFKRERPWGIRQGFPYSYTDKRGVKKSGIKYYQGCVMPWPHALQQSVKDANSCKELQEESGSLYETKPLPYTGEEDLHPGAPVAVPKTSQRGD